MSTTTKSMESITNSMTVSEIRGFIARLMVKADDLKRQKELISKFSWGVSDSENTIVTSAEDSEDLQRVVCMLDNELCQTRESVRKLKVIYKRRAAQLALSV